MRFDQELEPAEQIELLATTRQLFELPAEESSAVLERRTLAQLRDDLVNALAAPASAPPLRSTAAARPAR
jgi:hypothetical protein